MDKKVVDFRRERGKDRIAILTNFQDIHPRYSLTGIVKDQVDMLIRHGHEVSLFVSEKFNFKEENIIDKGNYPKDKFQLRNVIPFTNLTDYRSIVDLSVDDKDVITRISNVLVEELKDFDIALTHDFIFTGWNLIYGEGCKRAGVLLKHLKWMHWIHSVPSANSDWWAIKKYGGQHKIIYPNETDRIQVAEQYRGGINHVRSIPHIKDLRSWFDFCEETCRFIDAYPAVMQADIVQILPASVDRLVAKRVREVIRIFSNFKRNMISICLVVANQWATGRQQKEDVEAYKKFAQGLGLLLNEEFIFTSDFEPPKYDVGIPKRMIRELFQCSNLFIFPTREESFGLVIPEASLSGSVLLVLNKSLRMQLEVAGGESNALFFDFGSYHHTFNNANPSLYFDDIAKIVYGRLLQNESIRARTFMRQTYNWDSLYTKVYAPIFAESRSWE